MFFFANVQRTSNLLESSIGPCPSCGTASSVDLVEQTSKWFLFGVWPTEEKVDRIVCCKQCGKILKEAYYNMRDGQGDEKNEPVILVLGANCTISIACFNTYRKGTESDLKQAARILFPILLYLISSLLKKKKRQLNPEFHLRGLSSINSIRRRRVELHLRCGLLLRSIMAAVVVGNASESKQRQCNKAL
eukprot:scaffold6299_cov107-Cylindrotheca_fusiformis.AAC.4